MRAFVIKNKEGKYYDYWADCMIDKLDSTCIYLEKEQAEKDIVNCKSEDVVEITIAEGDLEEENKQLKEQLVKKDKEIEQLTTVNNYLFKINGELLEELGEGEQQ